jgi:hypothetical protein
MSDRSLGVGKRERSLLLNTSLQPIANRWWVFAADARSQHKIGFGERLGSMTKVWQQ